MKLTMHKANYIKLLKNTGGAAIVALQAYRNVLAVKLFSIDAFIKIIKSNKQPKLVEQASLQEKQNKIIVKEKKQMRKSNFWGILTFLVAVGAAIGAAAYYIHKKEQELNDYEDMLFDDEYLDDYMPEQDEDCGCDCGCEVSPEQPTEKTAEKEEPTFD